MFESRRRFSRRRRSPLASFRRRRARHLSSTPHLSSIMTISFSTAAAPRVNAAPPSSRRRCSSSRRSSRCLHSSGYHHSSLAALSPPHLSSDLSSMPRLLCVVPLLSSTPLLSSMPRLLAAVTSSVRPRLRPRHSHREVAPHALHVHVLFVGLTRLLCVRSENDVNVLLCVS